MKKLILASMLSLFATNAFADMKKHEEFYSSNPVNIIVGYGAGGGYDLVARMIARYMPDHLPGSPRVVVRNMPGAGSNIAANYLYQAAPKDGSTFGTFADVAFLYPLMGNPAAQFDPREFNWLGSVTSRSTPTLLMRADAPVKTLADLQKIEATIGASGPDASSAYGVMLNDLLGTKLKIIQGYKGSADIELAIQRNEVHGRVGAEWERIKIADWAKDGQVNILLQLSLKSHPDLKSVPVAVDLARNATDKQVMQMIFGTNQFYRVFAAPPGIEADRLKVLRKAFADVMNNPKFREEYKPHAPAGVDFSDHDEIMAYILSVYKLSPEIHKVASRYLGQ